MNLEKYINKLNILYIKTDSYKNIDYINAKNIYIKNIKIFHKNHIKLITKRNKDLKFEILLIDFTGKIKYKFTKININKILKITYKLKIPKCIKPTNLSLYSDYNKDTSIKNLGFKNKEKALYTINKIKYKTKLYKINLINTMIGRASHHQYKTQDMKMAIKIFKKFIKKIEFFFFIIYMVKNFPKCLEIIYDKWLNSYADAWKSHSNV